VLLEIGVRIAGVDGTVGLDVHERVENVGDLGHGKIGRLVVAVIDTPVHMCKSVLNLIWDVARPE
jgi:hypothetical protein